MTPVEALKTGQTIMIDEGSWGRTAYVIHDIEMLHGGWEFVVTYGDERGRFTDTVSFEAGALVDTCEAEGEPVNLLDAVRQFRAEAAAIPISQAVVTDFICALVAASTRLAPEERAMEAAE